MVASVAEFRLKREDCKRTKHDSVFSNWKILVGPSDWEDFSLGKESAERYRLHNLPKVSSPGLYELGVPVRPTNLGREVARLEPDNIVVVYLGEAENVRTRLQHYGRSGSHLGNGYLPELSHSKSVPLQKGPGLFEEILSIGYPIVFRWAPVVNKSDAWKTETQLLRTFDYAWNSNSNGPRRRNDILQKLDRITSQNTKLSNIVGKLHLLFGQKEVGIRIQTTNLLSPEKKPRDYYTKEESYNFLHRIFKINRNQPNLVLNNRSDINEEHSGTICGVILGDNGSVCRKLPNDRRNRCLEHKGMKVNEVVLKLDKREALELICGVRLNDGSTCEKKPVQGRKRCDEHKGRRIYAAKEVKLEFDSDDCDKNLSFEAGKCFEGMCGVYLGGGVFCERKPVKGRVRCEEHKGMRVNGFASKR